MTGRARRRPAADPRTASESRGAVLYVALACVGAALAACGGPQPAPPTFETSSSPLGPHVEGSTEVVLFATIHEGHRASRRYSNAVLAEAIAEAEPSVILAEIPPALFDAVVDARGTCDDEWSEDHPEFCEVVIPTADSLGIEVIPIAEWSEEMAMDRDRYWDIHPTGPLERIYLLVSHRFQAAQLTEDARENPRWLHGEEFLELSTSQGQWLAYFADEMMGSGGELTRGAGYNARILDAIAAHRGERIAIVAGSSLRYLIEPAVRVYGGVEVLDASVLFEPLPEDERSTERRVMPPR